MPSIGAHDGGEGEEEGKGEGDDRGEVEGDGGGEGEGDGGGIVGQAPMMARSTQLMQ